MVKLGSTDGERRTHNQGGLGLGNLLSAGPTLPGVARWVTSGVTGSFELCVVSKGVHSSQLGRMACFRVMGYTIPGVGPGPTWGVCVRAAGLVVSTRAK